MPKTKQTSKAFAKRFAALLAGADTGNACEEEALSKFRAMRHMADEEKLRIVDLMEREDVRQAIDDQLQPLRHEKREPKGAMQQAASLREELIQCSRETGRLAELLRRERKTTETLRKELAAVTCELRDTQTQNRQPSGTVHPAHASNKAAHSFGAQSSVFEFVVVGAALVLMGMAVIHW